MGTATFADALATEPSDVPRGLRLTDGSQVGVIGGGPAGSLFSYFLLGLAEQVGLRLQVDIYEPRDFTRLGPPGCNMCGGIISETLVQNLATEGINLPPTIVQRGIDGYTLHMDVGAVRIGTPLEEKRIAAVYRGPGPLRTQDSEWGSFDGHLQDMAVGRGARILRSRVDDVGWDDGRPKITSRNADPQTYDLLVVATGVNSVALPLFERLGVGYHPPTTTKTYIREYELGQATLARCLGNSMHVFLLDLPGLDFAAVIPKGNHASVCLLGDRIDQDLLASFLGSAEVRSCFPDDWHWENNVCQCAPRMNLKGAARPFADRVVFVGDAGVTRLYKDGIGAAYRTAKAAATTAIFDGIAAPDFQRGYAPICRSIESDNRIGKLLFAFTHLIQTRPFTRRTILRLVQHEQQGLHPPRMSGVLWDLFTGSAPYKDILRRTLHPAFLWRLGCALVASLSPFRVETAPGDRVPGTGAS